MSEPNIRRLTHILIACPEQFLHRVKRKGGYWCMCSVRSRRRQKYPPDLGCTISILVGSPARPIDSLSIKIITTAAATATAAGATIVVREVGIRC